MNAYGKASLFESNAKGYQVGFGSRRGKQSAPAPGSFAIPFTMAKKPLSSSTSTTAVSTFIDDIKVSKQNRIPAIHLEELAAIWNADKRTPTAASRRAWALARNVSPVKVNNWWYRKKTLARKNGIVLPEETYDLPVGIVPPKISSLPIPDPKTSVDSGLGFMKKEEPQPEYEQSLLSGSDDLNFGINQLSSDSSDTVGPFTDSDDNKYSVRTPMRYIAETSFSLNGRINIKETPDDGAYIQHPNPSLSLGEFSNYPGYFIGTSMPYIAEATSYFSSNGRIIVGEDKKHSAYIQSPNAPLPLGEFSNYPGHQSRSMLSQFHVSGTGTGLFPCSDVVTSVKLLMSLPTV